MASRGNSDMFIKTALLFLTSSFVFTFLQVTQIQPTQAQKTTPVVESDESQFYHAGNLRPDYALADIVAHVNVTERELVDSLGSGDCENDKGTGYCLYRLKGE